MEQIQINEALNYLIKEANSPLKTPEERAAYQKYMDQLTEEEEAELQGHFSAYQNAAQHIHDYVTLQHTFLPGMTFDDYRNIQDNSKSEIERIWALVLERLET